MGERAPGVPAPPDVTAVGPRGGPMSRWMRAEVADLDRQSTIAHVSGIAAMTAPESREHILTDLAGRLIRTIDDL